MSEPRTKREIAFADGRGNRCYDLVENGPCVWIEFVKIRVADDVVVRVKLGTPEVEANRHHYDAGYRTDDRCGRGHGVDFEQGCIPPTAVTP